MAKIVTIQKSVTSKQDFERVVDTSFKTFTQPTTTQDTDTVEELFRLYAKLYYEIPIEGAVDSHTYLVQESSKLVEFDRNTEEIQPLLDEISELRERLLQANQELIQVQTEQIQNGTN